MLSYFITLFIYYVSSSSVSNMQIQGLQWLYNSTSGDKWYFNKSGEIWNFTETDPDPCLSEWQGVSCTVGCSITCDIIGLSLNNMGLVGSLPYELNLLENLVSFNVNGNYITSVLPDSLGSLSNLQYLNVGYNTFLSGMTSMLVTLEQLTYLDLSDCMFSGSLPALSMINLTVFDVSTNTLTGSLPSSLSSCSNLQVFRVHDNKFGGPLYNPISALNCLEEYSANLNYFSGPIPSCICELSMCSIFDISSNGVMDVLPYCSYVPFTVFNVGQNNITGSIPSEIGNWTRLIYLDVSFNALNGTIPHELGMLSSLELLHIGFTNLHGPIPSSFVHFSNISYVFLGNNHLSGSIPTFFVDFQHLSVLSLSGNSLTHSIPFGFGNLTGLKAFEIGRNLIAGHVPSDIWASRNLQALLLYNNKLSGSIPDSLAFDSMQLLFLDYNSFTGTLSTSLVGLSELMIFSVSFNSFTGSLPHFNACDKLIAYIVADNLLSGNVPVELAQCSALRNFYLYSNPITGSLSDGFFDLSNLVVLSLSDCSISGSLPSAMNLPNITDLFMEANLFTGSIPDAFFLSTKLLSVELQSNSFSGRLSSLVSELKSLTLLNVEGNFLTGTLPSFQEVPGTSLLFGGNSFHGTVVNIFNGSVLQLIDLSNNGFSGELPYELFQSPTLQTFSAAKNCFSGVVSGDLCQATGLQFIDLSGLLSGLKCRVSTLVKNVFFSKYVPGVLPACLFRLPKLEQLYASGNGLYCTLPDIPASSNITVLSVSNNRLYGTIPASIQEYTKFQYLNLAYNLLSGTLDDVVYFTQPVQSFDDSNSLNVSISLFRNRLSGTLLNSIAQTNVSMNILMGNLFGCDYSSSRLPQHDPHSEVYTCGSDELDGVVYVYSSLLALWFIIIAMVMTRLQWFSVAPYGPLVQQFLVGYRYMFVGEMINDSELMRKLGVSFYRFRRLCLGITLYLVFACMPCYIIFKKVANGIYSTHQYQYGWLSSLAFLQGLPAVLVVSLLWIVLMTALYFSASYMKLQITVATKKQQTKRRWALNFNEIVFLIVTIIVTSSVNGGYVYTVLTQGKQVRVIVLALIVLFKLVWNSWSFAFLQMLRASDNLCMFVVVFNTILCPVFATLCIDVSCFQNVFIAQSPVESSFVYYHCEYPATFTFEFLTQLPSDLMNEIVSVVGSIGIEGCLRLSRVQTQSSFYPPFIYSYQCGSAMLQNYVPIYVALYGVLGLLYPGVNSLVMLYFLPVKAYLTDKLRGIHTEKYAGRVRLWRRLKSNLEFYSYATGWLINGMVLPLDLTKDFERSDSSSVGDIYSSEKNQSNELSSVRPIPAGVGDALEPVSKPLYDIKYNTLNCAVSFILLITFGMSYPPLAVFLTLQIITTTILIQVCVWNHYQQLLASGDQRAMDRWSEGLLAECKEVYAILFHYIIVVLLAGSGYLSLFLLDIETSIVSAIVLSGINCLIIFGLKQYFARVRRRVRKGEVMIGYSSLFAVSTWISLIRECFCCLVESNSINSDEVDAADYDDVVDDTLKEVKEVSSENPLHEPVASNLELSQFNDSKESE